MPENFGQSFKAPQRPSSSPPHFEFTSSTTTTNTTATAMNDIPSFATNVNTTPSNSNINNFNNDTYASLYGVSTHKRSVRGFTTGGPSTDDPQHPVKGFAIFHLFNFLDPFVFLINY